ncbi:MAG TPA: polysaccharide deacetylase family protein [Casimicrobiaceae bacterium]|nr:polysaccharide deacetylase family protein [Casimicrobiaceae bacterium]
MRIPVLTYHSMRIDGNDYGTNDHVAFAEDLRTVTALGFRIVPASRIVQWLYEEDLSPGDDARLVAFTFDDGPDFDFHDLPHPTWGVQRSMLNVMRDFHRDAGTGAQPQLHATSFVIVSPEARRELDRTCMIGRDWWRDDWWTDAVASGLMSIASHSWNHNHPSLRECDEAAATFRSIDGLVAAEEQIARAAAFLRAKVPNDGDALFAYPYGEASDYLVDDYFPRHGGRLGIRGAFACGGAPVTMQSNPWRLPRYVFGHDWKTPDDLIAMLR